MKFTTTTSLTLLLAAANSTSSAPVTTIDSNKMTIQVTVDVNSNPSNPATVNANAINANDLFTFTSTQAVAATPDQVVNGTERTGGLASALGSFHFGLDSHSNTICYNITLHGFSGEFSSPAVTATHIHEAALGASGPPRIAFPDPQVVDGEEGGVRRSVGCVTGPFVTGVEVDGRDSGEGFHVSMIEANPAGFMADTHSSEALAGAVRGQLA